jgi:hypothetical protein
VINPEPTHLLRVAGDQDGILPRSELTQMDRITAEIAPARLSVGIKS